jgi:isopentenyl diphosphate isomerase/L-lactate dehydrogenase-like FMN-dependent dehydrogenase
MPSINFTLDGRQRPISVEDYRGLARKALPNMVWPYIDGGADDLTTLRSNRQSFARWALSPQVLTGNEGTELGVEIAGEKLDVPVFLSPTGLTGLAHWSGEVAAAQAAERAGTRAIISTAASYTPEEVSRATAANHFFQLYAAASTEGPARALSESFIDRADNAGYSALVITVDVPIPGNREGEMKYGMGVPPTLTPARVLHALTKPKWCYNLLRHQRISARMLVDSGGPKAAVDSAKAQYRLLRPELNWDDFSWMREQWKKPLYIKGVLDPEDASKAVGLGADGVIVSNHGGRQLDGVLSAVDALPAVVDRVGGRVPVFLDGGIRRGTDVVKALCLGATAVGIGRPYVYGLAAGGAGGVQRVIEILRDEVARTLTLMGCANIKDLNRSRLIDIARLRSEGLA